MHGEIGKEPCRESGGKRASRQSKGLEPWKCRLRDLFFIGEGALAIDMVFTSDWALCCLVPVCTGTGTGVRVGGQYISKEAASDRGGPSHHASLRQQGGELWMCLRCL